MALAFVASSTAGDFLSSFVLNKPTGTADNDLLVAIITHSTQEAPSSAPSGWLPATTGYWVNGYGGRRTSIWYKVASGEGASFTWAFPTGSSTSGLCVAYRGGFLTSNPLASISYPSGADESSGLCGNVTTAETGMALIALCGSSDSVGNDPVWVAPSSPSGFTLDVDTGVVDLGFGSWAAASQTWGSSGATGNVTMGMSDVGAIQGCLIALNKEPLATIRFIPPLGPQVELA